MSLSDIIALRFKKLEKINKVTTPQEVATLIIKAPEYANAKENTEGNNLEQQEYNSKLADIETNKMQLWADMKTVKNKLWQKLHTVKDTM